MEQMKKDGRQPFRLWFEFYKLALNNPDLKSEIKQSHDFYKPWGNIEGVRFDDWYMANKHLFADQLAITVSDKPSDNHDPEYLHLKIPKSWSITKTLKELKTHLDGKVGQIIAGKKHKNAPKALYRITHGKELKTTNMNFSLVVYRDVYLKLGKPPINQAFIDEVHKFYKSRKRNTKIPSTMGFEGNIIHKDSVERTLRRYIQKAKLLEKNAAIGVFPGEDYKD